MIGSVASLRTAAASGLVALALALTPVRADEIVYLTPTSQIVSTSETYVYPTSSIVSTSYIVPSSYITSTRYVYPRTSIFRRPTVIAETSYLAPTTGVYLPTTYVRRPSGMVYLTPTYYVAPLSYLAPTSYIAPTRYVASNDCAVPCCDTGAAPASRPAAAAPSKPAVTSRDLEEDRVERQPEADPETQKAEQRRRPTITSQPKADGTGAAAPQRPVSESPPAPTPPTSARTPQGSPFDTNATPASSPVSSKTDPIPPPITKPSTPASTPAAAPVPKPAAAPAQPAPSEPDLGPANLPDIPPPLGAPESSKRNTLRPVIRDADVSTVGRARNVLQGRVLNSETGEAEEGVTVLMTDRLKRFADRTVRSDAFGRFAVSLPEGDWTVQVSMPGGEIYNVGKGDLTATAGKIVDQQGREISLLTIRR